MKKEEKQRIILAIEYIGAEDVERFPIITLTLEDGKENFTQAINEDFALNLGRVLDFEQEQEAEVKDGKLFIYYVPLNEHDNKFRLVGE